MELNWIDDCLALADTLNFRRAAEMRHLTQPAFSRRIRALEDWVGTPLFERSRQGVALTPAGAAFHDRASALQRAIHAARNEALDVAGLRKPPLVFVSTHALSFTFFPAWIRRANPDSTPGAFQLVSDTLRASERRMLEDGAQFMLCHHHPQMRSMLDPSRFDSVAVGQDVLQPFSAPGARGQPKWSLDGSARTVPVLSYSDDSGLARILAGNAHLASMADRFAVRFTSDLAATLRQMCKAGDGIAWLPRTLVEDDLQTGALVAASSDAACVIPVDIRLFRRKAPLGQDAEALWLALNATR